MRNLADAGCVCECGKRLVPRGVVRPSGVLICDACARCYQLAQVRFSAAAAVLADEPYELQAFEWTRRGVPLEHRRTLAELAESAPSRAGEKSAAVLLAVLVLLVLLVVIRTAVHS